MGKSKGWVVLCKLRDKDEEQRPFEADGKNKSQAAASKQTPKQE